MSDKKFLIYKHTAPNGKSYIGQTSNLAKRNLGHQTKTGCRAFHSAIKKYGWDNFTREILAENLTLDEANTLEERFIADHGTLSPGGYNLRLGGNNSLHSEESKALQRSAKLGRRHTPEAIAKISAATRAQSAATIEKRRKSCTGLKRDDETRAKMAKAMRGLKRSPDGCANIKAGKQNISAETRERMAASAARRIMSDEGRAKLSAARSGKTRTFSEQGRANIVAAHKGKVVSPESRLKMSNSAKVRKAREAAMRGLSYAKS